MIPARVATLFRPQPGAGLTTNVGPPDRGPWWAGVTVVLLTLVGFAPRVYAAVERPLWVDETFSVCNAVEHTYADLVRGRDDEPNHPPLSFLLIKLCVDVFGSTAPLVVRLPSLLAGATCVPLAYLLGRAAWSPGMGVVTAGFAAFDPLLVDQSGQARMFSAACLSVVAAAVVTIRLLQIDARITPWAVGLGLILGVGLWNSQLALVTWGGSLGSLVAAGLVVRRDRRRLFQAAVVAGTVGAAVAAPWVYDLAANRIRQSPSGPPPGIATIASELYPEYLGLTPAPSSVGVLRTPLLPAIGLLLLIRARRPAALPVTLYAAAAIVLAVLLRQRHPFFAARYLIPLLPCLWIGLASLPICRHRRVHLLGLLTVALYLVMYARCSLLPATRWQQVHGFAVARETAEMRPLMEVGDRIVFQTAMSAATGRYLGLPLDPELQRQLSLTPPGGEAGIRIEDPSRGTWLICPGLNRPERVAQARQQVLALAAGYKVVVEQAELAAQVAVGHFVAIQVTREGVRFVSKRVE